MTIDFQSRDLLFLFFFNSKVKEFNMEIYFYLMCHKCFKPKRSCGGESAKVSTIVANVVCDINMD